jgi:nitrogen fixation protein FixH
MTFSPLSGRAVLVWLTGFFGIIIAVNIIFITMSVKTFSGEDEQKPYLQGMEYNDTLARRAAQRRLGWQGEIGATRLAGGAVRITVAVKDAAGQPLRGLALAAELRHPADERRDRELSLAETAPGLYQSDVPGVAAGHWDVLVTAKSRQPFAADRRLWVP